MDYVGDNNTLVQITEEELVERLRAHDPCLKCGNIVFGDLDDKERMLCAMRQYNGTLNWVVDHDYADTDVAIAVQTILSAKGCNAIRIRDVRVTESALRFVASLMCETTSEIFVTNAIPAGLLHILTEALPRCTNLKWIAIGKCCGTVEEWTEFINVLSTFQQLRTVQLDVPRGPLRALVEDLAEMCRGRDHK